MAEIETNSSSKNDSEINVQNTVKREAGGSRVSQVSSVKGCMDDGTTHRRNIKSRQDVVSLPVQKSFAMEFYHFSWKEAWRRGG